MKNVYETNFEDSFNLSSLPIIPINGYYLPQKTLLIMILTLKISPYF